jgi:outer membrane biosynthesis protein TonB
VFKTPHQRKSAVITALILLLLIVGFFNFGMQYLDPPEEYGLAINFGDSTIGIGEPAEKATKSTSTKVVEQEEVKVLEEAPKENVQEEMITNDKAEEVSVVEKVKEVHSEPLIEVVKKEISKEKPTPSKETTAALNSLLNGNASDGQPKGEGDTTKEGIKGSEKGDSDANRYYGNMGIGSDRNYNLAGRKALLKPKKQPDCQEEGVVVVRITVDNTGRVMTAIPGVKGTTNSAACLLKPAKEAALNTQWNADSNAPLKQTGTIIYKFSLSE